MRWSAIHPCLSEFLKDKGISVVDEMMRMLLRKKSEPAVLLIRFPICLNEPVKEKLKVMFVQCRGSNALDNQG